MCICMAYYKYFILIDTDVQTYKRLKALKLSFPNQRNFHMLFLREGENVIVKHHNKNNEDQSLLPLQY